MTNERALVPLRPATPDFSFDELMKVGGMLADSGYFKDATQQAQAVAKILYGLELGIGPASSMKAVHIIEGTPTLSAPAIATLVKRSGKYNYRVKRLDDQACVITFYEHGEVCGESSFTLADAAKANLANKLVWKSYPRNMLFSRAMANGARWYCADVFGGSPVYTPEEVGAHVDEDSADVIVVDTATGEIVEGPGDVDGHGDVSDRGDGDGDGTTSAVASVPDRHSFRNLGEFLSAATVEFDMTKAQIEQQLEIHSWAALTVDEYPKLWQRLLEAHG